MAHRSRRTFLKASVASAAGAGLAASRALNLTAASQDRVEGASRRIRVGLIGCGGMGVNDLRAMLRSGVQCVALCDVDDEQSARARESVSKDFNQTVEFVTRDFRRVLDRTDVDAVIVGTITGTRSRP
jgi:predicted homoserine dehydrogenase-like protein